MDFFWGYLAWGLAIRDGSSSLGRVKAGVLDGSSLANRLSCGPSTGPLCQRITSLKKVQHLGIINWGRGNDGQFATDDTISSRLRDHTYGGKGMARYIGGVNRNSLVGSLIDPACISGGSSVKWIRNSSSSTFKSSDWLMKLRLEVITAKRARSNLLLAFVS
ncbi:hypothetical protein Ancab_022959 [Ancistrocladus abbreviatus]